MSITVMKPLLQHYVASFVAKVLKLEFKSRINSCIVAHMIIPTCSQSHTCFGNLHLVFVIFNEEIVDWSFGVLQMLFREIRFFCSVQL